NGQGSPALDLPQRPSVPEPVRVDAFLDTGLRREPLAERSHVAVPERLAAERAKQRVAAGEPEPRPTFEPAVGGARRGGGERGCPRVVALAVEHAEGATGRVEVLREQCERLGYAEAAPEQHGQEGTVANASRCAPGAGCAECFDVGECEGLSGE